jgi:hypothetical protein
MVVDLDGDPPPTTRVVKLDPNIGRSEVGIWSLFLDSPSTPCRRGSAALLLILSSELRVYVPVLIQSKH